MKPTVIETPWEAMLEYSGRLQPDKPVEMSICIVATPTMQMRRRVSIEEFEADMRKARSLSSTHHQDAAK